LFRQRVEVIALANGIAREIVALKVNKLNPLIWFDIDGDKPRSPLALIAVPQFVDSIDLKIIE
jgi:hypothetical protein